MTQTSQESPQNGSESGQEAREVPEVPPEADSGSESESGDQDQDQFPREYVQQLRAEAKEARERAKRVDFLETECRRLATREAARGVLADPDSLTWSDEFNDSETGLPDHDRIRQAAEALATERPYLARPQPIPGQGEHGTGEQPVSLSALLRG